MDRVLAKRQAWIMLICCIGLLLPMGLAQAATVDLKALLDENKNVTLDPANTYTLDARYIFYESGSITGNGATLNCTGGGLQIREGNTLTISGLTINHNGTGLTAITSSTLTGSDLTINTSGENPGAYISASILNLTNVTINNGNYGILGDPNSTINLTDTSISNAAIDFQISQGKVVWDGGTVTQTGGNAISVINSEAHLSNLTMNISGSGGIGINFYETGHGQVHGVTITGADYAIQIGSGDVIVDQNSTFSDGVGSGIAVNTGGSVTVDGCTFTGFQNAVDIQPSTPPGTGIVRDCNFIRPNVSAVNAANAVDVLVSNCIVTDAQKDGIFYYQSTGIIENCQVLRALNTGITFYECPSGTVRNCLVQESVHQGIFANYGVDVIGNTCVGNIVCNILVPDSSPARVMGNICIDAPDTGMRFDASSSDASFMGNLIFENLIGVEMKNGSNAKMALSGVLQNQRTGLLAYGASTNMELQNCYIANNGADTSTRYYSIFVNEGAGGSGHGCSIGLPGEWAMYNDSDGVAMDFTNNFWGAAEGPNLQAISGSSGSILEWDPHTGSTVNYSPFLANEPVTVKATRVSASPASAMNWDSTIGLAMTVNMASGGSSVSNAAVGALKCTDVSSLNQITPPTDILNGQIYVSWVDYHLRANADSGSLTFNVAGASSAPGLSVYQIDGTWKPLAASWDSGNQTLTYKSNDPDMLNGIFGITTNGPSEARFTSNQIVRATSDAQLSLQAWNYTSSQWVGTATDYQTAVLEFEASANDWIAVLLYDEANGAWIGGNYILKEQWVAPSNTVPAMAHERKYVSGAPSASPVFAETQSISAGAAGSYEIGAWNYGVGDWAAQKSTAGADNLDFTLASGQWMSYLLYDLSSGQWTEGMHSYMELW
ncbi:MAG: right-handed parallel beta-helix repeat-containing protein [Candidatus Sumerlaeia bacterium]